MLTCLSSEIMVKLLLVINMVILMHCVCNAAHDMIEHFDQGLYSCGPSTDIVICDMFKSILYV